MERKQVGIVKALWRYPVKSMLGEKLDRLYVTTRGPLGDRAWALRDAESKRIASAKKFSALLTIRAAYEREPEPGELAPVRITLPDGRSLNASDGNASELISEVAGHRFQIEREPHQAGERAGIDPSTVFGDVPFENVFPGMTADKAPDWFNLAKGTFFDSALIHFIATGTLEYMNRQSGGKSDFDYRRFRPNMVIDTGSDNDGFIEDRWLKGALEVGDGVRIIGMQPALRCVMTTHQQQDLPRDLAILRATVKQHHANLGVFAGIDHEGMVRVGDPVFLVS